MALSAASPVPRGDCVHRDERGAERVREGGEREREREGETVRVESFIVWKWQPYELSLS